MEYNVKKFYLCLNVFLLLVIFAQWFIIKDYIKVCNHHYNLSQQYISQYEELLFSYYRNR